MGLLYLFKRPFKLFLITLYRAEIATGAANEGIVIKAAHFFNLKVKEIHNLLYNTRMYMLFVHTRTQCTQTICASVNLVFRALDELKTDGGCFV